MAKPRMKIKSFTILDWTVPMFGNTHSYPYFTLRVVGEDGTEKTVKTREEGTYTFFTFMRKRYYFSNKGTSYSPKLEILEEGRMI